MASVGVPLFEATVAEPPQPEHVQSGQSRRRRDLGFQIEGQGGQGCIASPRTKLFETRFDAHVRKTGARCGGALRCLAG